MSKHAEWRRRLDALATMLDAEDRERAALDVLWSVLMFDLGWDQWRAAVRFCEERGYDQETMCERPAGWWVDVVFPGNREHPDSR